MRRKTIYTSNEELYKKLNNLHFIDRVVLENVTPSQMTKIIKNVNKHNKILDVEKGDCGYTLKKVGKFDFLIYLTKR